MADDTDKPSNATADTTEPDQPSDDPPADPAPAADKPSGRNNRQPVTIPVRSLIFGVVLVALVAAVGVLTWLYLGAENKLQAQEQQAANYREAEQAALDYAVNAAEMNFKDLDAWKAKLVDGTSPELNEKLSKAADSMEQILVPLQWNSTAKPLVAKVRSESGGVYVVDAFVSVLTKTTQAPDGLQSTATYSITMDGNNDWQITDVGGIDAVVPTG